MRPRDYVLKEKIKEIGILLSEVIELTDNDMNAFKLLAKVTDDMANYCQYKALQENSVGERDLEIGRINARAILK